MRDLPISREDAENVVDMLEDCDARITGTWRHDLAARIRDLFGMVSFEEEYKDKLKTQ